MKHFAIIILTMIMAFLHATICHAQSDEHQNVIDFIRTAMNFNKVHPQEKVYLHFDNTGYFEGETMWFKAYVTRTDDGNFSDMSKVLYVDLLTPSGDVVQTRKLQIDERGHTHGELTLDSLLLSGYYEVRAYTRYMTNWGVNAMFSRVFPVFKKPKVEGDYGTPTIRDTRYKYREPNNRVDEDSLYADAIENGLYTKRMARNVSVRFYPEGGDMVQGKRCRVAVCAADEEGYPYEMVGQVLDANGGTLAIVRTDSTGRGTFELIPTEGEMTLVTTNMKNRVRRFSLPAARGEGCSLRLDALGDTLRMDMDFTDGLCGELMGYVVMNMGNVVRCDTLRAEACMQVAMPRSSMREGVSQFTLFASDGRIVAERMFFVMPKPEGCDSMSIKPATARLTPCGKVELEVQTLPGANFSFSAVDASSMNNARQGDMRTWMLLSSEVRGYIHDVDYYFEADDKEHREAADLLMLTQGWRRYDWRVMSGQEKIEGGQMIEDRFYVFGKLGEYRRRNKVGGVEMLAYLYNGQGQSLRGKTVTDPDGNYAFDLPFLSGEWRMEIDTKSRSGKGRMKNKTYLVAVDRQFAPEPRYITHAESMVVRPNRANLFCSMPDEQAGEDDGLISLAKRDRVLNNVTVKAKRYFTNDDFHYKNESYGRHFATIYYDVDRELDKVLDKGENVPNLPYWLMEKNSLFKYDYNDRNSPKYAGRYVRFVVDNQPLQSAADGLGMESFVPKLFLDEIKSVYIVPYSPWEEDMCVLVYVYRHHKFSSASQKGIRHTYFQGFNIPETFKVEDYTGLPPMEDFRRTLHWAPDVKADMQGKAKIVFWNNSSCKEMFVSAEGMSEDGKIVVY